MSKRKINVAIVGCGNIAGKYVEQIKTYDNVKLLGFADAIPERAGEFAAKYGGKAYQDLETLLADPAVEIVVNLTIHHAHAEVITQCLLAGKHVYSEKPFALSYRDAKTILDLAKQKERRVGSAPITYLGEAQQTAWKMIRDGRLGKLRLIYAEVNHDRIEKWHPNPIPFFEVGILWDVAIYPLTLLTAMLGPVRRVNGLGWNLLKDRVTLSGEKFRIATPDFKMALLEFASEAICRLTANFYVNGGRQGHTLEFHGDEGRLFLGSWFQFGAPLEFAAYKENYARVPLRRPAAYKSAEYARGLQEMADAILKNRPHRASGEHAAHVVEVIEAIEKSIEAGKARKVISNFPPPAPMDWAK
jgi:predicted dehydrogenase